MNLCLTAVQILLDLRKLHYMIKSHKAIDLVISALKSLFIVKKFMEV